MPIANDSFDSKTVQDAASRSAEFRANAGDRIISHPDENWRPPGIRISEPLRFVDTNEVADNAVRSLGAIHNLWQRNSALAHIVVPNYFEGRDGKQTPNDSGIAVIRECGLPIISRHLNNASKYWAYKGTNKQNGLHQWERTEPNAKLTALVASLGQYPNTPVLNGIIQAPSMRPDGSILDEPGYDEKTGFYFKPNGQFLKVPDSPTTDDVQRALRCLIEPFAAHKGYDSFPFVSEAHRWLPVAMALSILARPAIDGCIPFFGFDATDAGTGKGMCFDVVSMMTLGSLCGKSTFPTQAEELEKVLSAHAISGSQVICFDNVSAPVRGDALDKIATTPTVDFRVLGKSEIRKLEWKSVVSFTGNQLQWHGDTARRVLSCRQESPVELPSKRSNFKYRDLIGSVKKFRPLMIQAALTLLRAFVISGDTKAKDITKGFGSFNNWASLVPSAIYWANGVNVLDCRINLETADPLREAELNLFRSLLALQELRKVGALTTNEILSAAYEMDTVGYAPMRREPRFPELNAAVEELGASFKLGHNGMLTVRAMASILNKRSGLLRGNLRLGKLHDDSRNVHVWRVTPGKTGENE